MFWIFLGVFVLIIFVIVIMNMHVVQQSRAYVIERLGAYSTTWNVGLHFKIPFFERVDIIAEKLSEANYKGSIKKKPTYKKMIMENSSFVKDYKDIQKLLSVL